MLRRASRSRTTVVVAPPLSSLEGDTPEFDARSTRSIDTRRGTNVIQKNTEFDGSPSITRPAFAFHCGDTVMCCGTTRTSR